MSDRLATVDALRTPASRAAVEDAAILRSALPGRHAHEEPRAPAGLRDGSHEHPRHLRPRSARHPWLAIVAPCAAVAAVIVMSPALIDTVRTTGWWTTVHRALDPMTPTVDASLLLRLVLIALATLVSEDATCIATGLLVARGEIGFVAGSVACFTGIFVGDLLLFWTGRLLGRRALGMPLLRGRVGPAALARASAWLERRGPAVIALSRLTPGMRLPTYLAAGALDTPALTFAGYFFVAAALWTPALVALARQTGAGASDLLGSPSLLVVAVAGLAVLLLVRGGPALLTHRGRRLAIGRWRRLRRWEFWPLQVVYVPVVAYVAWLAVKHRSLTLPTAANPAIAGGGFAGESKHAILLGLAGSPEASLRATLVRGYGSLVTRVAAAEAFLAAARLDYPVVVKPDVGERGHGVVFAHSREQLVAALASSAVDLVVQQVATGPEFGIFYVRDPGAPRGRIFSITEKILPVVRGDGVRTLEQLILDDERAVCMARTHLARFADRLDEVPAAGVEIRLVDVGTHSRGAIFRDAAWARTPALEDAIDAISRRYDGFHFGRYDVRVASHAELLAGRGLKIVELNGLTAEATHIYHPGSSLLAAYRVLFEQWRIAFAIGAANRARGHEPTSVRALVRLVRQRSALRTGS
jgi:membrane protein DedA with SNARE-associated domain